MSIHIALTFLLTITPALTLRFQHDHAAAAGTPSALTPQAVQQLLNGEGMGLANAAEANGYPGPKHVLDLATELGVSPEQRAKVEAIRGDMLQKAKALGRRIVDAETALDAAFRGGDGLTEEQLQRQVAAIGQLQQELRFTHLRAHLQTKPLLSAEQVKRYYEHRKKS